MSEEKFDAKVDKVSGSVKESVGKLTGDKEVESEGKVDKLKGHAKKNLLTLKIPLRVLQRALRKRTRRFEVIYLWKIKNKILKLQ